MKKTSKLLAMVLVLCLAVALSVLPAAAFAYTPVSGSTTTLYKDLVMDADANVPNASFTFTIAPGPASSGSTGQAPISAGIGSPTITSPVTFGPSDSTTAGVPGDSTQTGSKYARKTITVNFSGVSFDEPGIYRYQITESGSNQGVTNDANPVRYLDVYVLADGDTALTVDRYVLWTVENGSTTTKPAGYVNTYSTYDLTLSKTVTGNQGSRDKYFKFVVTISDAVAGTVYTVDRSNADSTVGANTATLDAYEGLTNPTSLTVGSGGTATGTFYLMHGQSITINGLATGTKYAIVETSEDYSPSYKINNGSATNGASCPATAISADTTVAFTNNRAGTIPTGVMVSVLPGVLFLGIAISVVVLFGRKSKEQEE